MDVSARTSSRAGPEPVLADLRRMGIVAAEETPHLEQLAGGVSSDIWRVELADGPVCYKRALAKLKVAADWRAPIERNAYEVAWFEVVTGIEPEVVPRLLGHDAAAGCFVMAYLDPVAHPLWKAELAAGRVDPAFAATVGDMLGRIHAATAGQPEVADRFRTDEIFHSIRLEPYLEATAEAHPDRAGALHDLVAVTARTRRVLVHGDVSPKNILVGLRGPVFLDAECAWYGDPAFDLAFCLNHLLLKCLWVPDSAPRFLEAFDGLATAYLGQVAWEPVAEVERRTARLLPGLLLARVDGKSPVEYLTTERQRDTVRGMARRFLADPVARLDDLRSAWAGEVGAV